MFSGIVSTLAVEWIEIGKGQGISEGGVSPPSRWSGLKFAQMVENHNGQVGLHPRGGVD